MKNNRKKRKRKMLDARYLHLVIPPIQDLTALSGPSIIRPLLWG